MEGPIKDEDENICIDATEAIAQLRTTANFDLLDIDLCGHVRTTNKNLKIL